jgi:hypothetical protein
MNDATSLDDNLALLSLRVAQEVDRRFGGRKSDSVVFGDFKRELSKASGLGESHSTAFLHADPITTEVFAEAIGDAWSTPLSDVASLSDAVMKIIAPLDERKESLSDSDLAMIKGFCLSLHKAIMAHRLPPLYDGDNSLEDEFRIGR